MSGIGNGWEGLTTSRLIELAGGNKEESLESLEERISNLYEMSFKDSLFKTDIVADFGSGFGSGAKKLSSFVDKVYCFDVSHTFLEKCRENTEKINNIETILIKRNDISEMYGKKINKIISNAVFCHFNIIEIAYYLKEFYNLLPTAGQVIFSFRDADMLDINDNLFKEHQRLLMNNREFVTRSISFVSRKTVVDVCNQIGYNTYVDEGPSDYKTVIAVKV